MLHKVTKAVLAAVLMFTFVFSPLAVAGSKKKAVDINSAPAKKLRELKGIGKVISKRIVDYRKKNGKFERPRDIMKVDGIGEKTFTRLKDKLKVSKKSKAN